MDKSSPPPLRMGGLRFVDPALERAFRADYGERILRQTRVALLLAAVLYLLLGWQDLWLFSERYPRLWLVRSLMAGLLLTIWWLSFRPSFRRLRVPLLTLVTLAAGAGAIAMAGIGWTSDAAASYYLGLALVIIWAYAISGLRFMTVATVNLILLATYLLVSLRFNGASTMLGSNLSNLAATSVLVGFAACLIEQQRRVLFFQASLLDAERRSHEQRALSDHLTGLPNRAYIERRLTEAICRARRNNTVFALIFIDMVDFKPINDLHGHNVGDQVLAVVARGLEETLRGNDAVGRLGGDEFVALLEEVAERDEVIMIGEKLRAAVARPVTVMTAAGELSLQVSASIGVALFPADAGTAQALLQAADAAMYRDKRARRAAGRSADVG